MAGWKGKEPLAEYPEASTNIGSQPPAKHPNPTRMPACHHPTLPPSTEDPGRHHQPGQPSPAGADPGPAPSLPAAAHRSLQSCQSCLDFPLLPSRCNDNNSHAPLRCLFLTLSITFASTPTASLQAARNVVTITSTPPSQHANKSSRHAHISPHLQRLEPNKQPAAPRPPPPIGTRPPPPACIAAQFNRPDLLTTNCSCFEDVAPCSGSIAVLQHG